MLAYSEQAAEQLRHLNKETVIRIKSYIDKVLELEDPRSRGQGLSGSLAGYWRYRIGDYRVVVAIEDDRLVIIALTIAHRSTVYRTIR
ncbi:MAG: type II toxin-antitoxin system RelE/ParE family toxin [Propionibacteriaceae bacterium]|nr:type II toxin-antitoxin system RelE/ParE family toxin [Propionibacteriaceae bacterium]